MAPRIKKQAADIPDVFADFDPTDFSMFMGLQVPDPITFCLGAQWLNQRRLYPRQATLLKIRSAVAVATTPWNTPPDDRSVVPPVEP